MGYQYRAPRHRLVVVPSIPPGVDEAIDAEHSRRKRYRPKPKAAVPKKAEVKLCGTRAAYTRHLRRGETPCQPCRDAQAESVRSRRALNAKPRILTPCGTEAAYRRHHRNGEEVCGPCLEAHAIESRRTHRKAIA